MTIYELTIWYYYLEILHLSTNYYCIFRFLNVKYFNVNTYHLGDKEIYEKLLASATAVTLLTVGYSSSAFAAKSPNDTKTVAILKVNKMLKHSGIKMDMVLEMIHTV